MRKGVLVFFLLCMQLLYAATPFPASMEKTEKYFQSEVQKAVHAQKVQREAIERGYWIFFFMLLPLLLWLQRERMALERLKKSVVVRYRPLGTLSVLQHAYLFYRNFRLEDVSAALLELVLAGYMEIVEEDGKKVLQKKDPATVRGRLSFDQAELFDALFEGGDRLVFDNKEEARAIRLGVRLGKIAKDIRLWAAWEGYTIQNVRQYRARVMNMILGLMLFLVLATTYVITNYYSIGYETQILLILSGIVFLPAVVISFMDISLKKKLIGVLAGIFLGYLAVHLTFFDPYVEEKSDLLSSPIVPTVLLFILISDLYRNIRFYTKKGRESYRYIEGFRRFVKGVKADEAQQRMEDDDYYTGKMLPYVVLFEELDHWLDIYDVIAVTSSKR